jgi:tRNA:m4X modification enzyme
MDEWGLFDLGEHTHFVEFGAGKAGLSSFVSATAKPGSVFVVNDREARRNKLDKVMRERGFVVHRDTVDIKDYNLANTEYTDIVGIAKHLCGGATDLTLMALKHS